MLETKFPGRPTLRKERPGIVRMDDEIRIRGGC
jgi:hypothetical protein